MTWTWIAIVALGLWLWILRDRLRVYAFRIESINRKMEENETYYADWVEKRNNCSSSSVLVDLEWEAKRSVNARIKQLEGSEDPLPECGSHREDPGFFVKRDGKGIVSFHLGCFPEKGDISVQALDEDFETLFEWCIQVRPGRHIPCALVINDQEPELDMEQVLYRALNPILF